MSWLKVVQMIPAAECHRIDVVDVEGALWYLATAELTDHSVPLYYCSTQILRQIGALDILKLRVDLREAAR